ncbi:hypothetical protein GGR54DRAFT_319368 [Hypoxylon sp. NC1633]|nr:hypothetical protein GGR54DRAFT_319368 [Hypoxylon sp. NC1633]
MADMILPKGIVFNRNAIYEEIAKYDIVPLEQILAACHVFTTTSRELVDPTARRLENFWTRVLGGDRRHLPGTVIARLFKSISEEESFVKLRGPPNRYEPPSPHSKDAPSTRDRGPAETFGEGPSKTKAKGKAKATRIAPSSSTKQPHPILKKPRGPSSSGPRPTARFVSPPGSDGEDDDGKEGDLASSGSTAVNHSGDSKGSNSSTAKEDRKKTTNTTPKKKTTAFVASTASRRRPVMPRRVSSQSSAAASGGSEVGSKEGGSSLGSRHSGSQSSVPTISERPTKVEESDERLSAKAAGKRPATRPLPDKATTTTPSSSQTTVIHDRAVTAKDKLPSMEQPVSAADNKEKSVTDSVSRARAGQSGTIHRRSDTQERPRPNVAPIMTRSRSDVGYPRRGSQDLTRVRAPQSLISSSTTTVSNTTVQATIIEFDENSLANEVITGTAQGREEDAEAGPGNSVLNNRFTPTQPSTAPTVPLGRSKSQLTLLLERQGDKKSRRY